MQLTGACRTVQAAGGDIVAPLRLVRQGEVDALRRLLADRLGWDFDISELGGLEEDDEDAPVVVQL